MLNWLSNNWFWVALGAFSIAAIVFVIYLIRYAKQMLNCGDEEELYLFYNKSKEDEIEKR